MSKDRWDKIEQIFHAALERPAHERDRFIADASSGDEEIQREVEALLRESVETRHFMESPAGGFSVTALQAPSLEGQKLNHYVIGSLVGSGGMAEVYRARDTKLGRDVAIKVLHHVRFVDRGRLDPMYREARVLASLNHPNIASIYGIEESDGLCGLVLELVEGESLAERIQRAPLDPSETLRIARQIIAGLRAAHAKGIIHRDLKPSNIKLTPDGTVKLVDFGLAKLLRSLDIDESVPNISHQGLVLGTVAYMSPEQARGKPVDARTDVWSFGCVLYEMLSGKSAFRGETPTDIIIKIASEEPDWKEIPRPSGSQAPQIETLLRRCLQKDPTARFSSIDEIELHLDGIPSRAQRPDHTEFALPTRRAFPLFMFAQVGYLSLYASALYHIDSVARILAEDFEFPERASLVGTLVLAMCGIAIRVYLISAIGWRHPEAGRKFILLFPLLLVFDGIWAASPLLLWHHIGYGPAFAGVALLAYVPFAQRTLVRTLYSSSA